MSEKRLSRLFLRVTCVLATLLAANTASHEAVASAQERVDSGYVTVHGGRLYCETAGQGAAVVLIHGGFGDRRMWDAQFAALAQTYRVVRYDHRGFGRSTPPDTAYLPTRDLLTLFDHLDIGSAHVIGNSIGGGVALDFAVQHPERVRKLVVVASGANGYPYDDGDFASMLAVFKTGEQDVDRAAAMWLQDSMIAVASRHPRSAALVRQMVLDNRSVFGMKDWPWETFTPPAYERLAELRMPVLLVIGDEDTPVVRRVVDATAERLRNAEVFRMPGADHLPQMVDPISFNRRLLAFLARPGPR